MPGFGRRQTPSEFGIDHLFAPFILLFCAVDDLNDLLGCQIRIELSQDLDQGSHGFEVIGVELAKAGVHAP